MKKYFLISVLLVMVVLGSFFSFPSSVEGFQATSTWDIRTAPPTPNGTAVFFPTYNVGLPECPEGTPIGWGVITPCAPWLALCNACIPASPTYTDFSWPTQGTEPCLLFDPEYILECRACLSFSAWDVENHVCQGGTVTPSPTISPTATTSCPAAQSGWDGETFVPNWSSDYLEIISNTSDAYHIDMTIRYFWPSGAVGWTEYPGVQWTDQPETTYFYERVTVTDMTGTTLNMCHVWDGVSHGDCSGSILQRSDSTTGYTQVGVTVDSVPAQFYVRYELSSSCDMLPITTPTPSSITNYCDVVSECTVDPSDITFWEPEGELQCINTPYLGTADLVIILTNVIEAVDLFGFLEIPLSWALGWLVWAGETAVPAQTICFQGYAFLDLNVFGVVIGFGFFFAVIIVVYLLNTLRKK